MHAMNVYTQACKFATSAFAKYEVKIIFMLQFKGLNTLVLTIVPATNAGIIYSMIP